MSKFIIKGGKRLSGEIKVSGSKNALFPLLAASLLTTEECRFTNVPEILDKQVMVEILKDLGVKVQVKPHELIVQAENLTKTEVDPQFSSKLRGSIVLLGGLLGRAGTAKMTFPGGDAIGKRPIDAHVKVFEDLGAKVSVDGGIEISADKLIGNKIILEESSVTATENAILAAAEASGRTIIKLAAMEPHVQQLCEFLNLMGAKISGIGTTTIILDGVEKLHGAEMAIIPDSNEAASLITLAAATKSQIKVTNLNPDFLDDFLLKLKNMKVNLEVGKDFVQILEATEAYQSSKIQCGLYPKLASDDVPALSVLATQAEGESLVYEWLYENRLGYVEQLKKMGAQAQILDSHQVKIIGPTPLKSAKIESFDLRMGITMVIAALTAVGESEIAGVAHIDRGYEQLEARLSQLGAEIKRVN